MELLLWRWSTAVQVTSAVMIALFFVALARTNSRAELRWWRYAWLANLAAMSITLAFWYVSPENPGTWFPLVRAGYMSTKTLFVLMLLQGAWALVRPGATLFSRRVRLGVFASLFVIGLLIPPSVELVGVIQHVIISVLLTGGAVVLARDRGATFLAAGFAVRAILALAESVAYASQLTPILPPSTADLARTFLSAASSFATGAEWLIALGSVLGVAERTQNELRENNQQLLAAQEDLRRLVDRDPLTGLDNRRALPKLLRRVQPIGATLLFFDIDSFKAINDLHGHHVGDQCLRQFADALRASFRPHDAVVRFAGDEFVVVATGLEQESAEERLEHLRSELQKAFGHVPVFTFSVGFSTLEPGGDPETALHAADQRMYQTKGTIAV